MISLTTKQQLYLEFHDTHIIIGSVTHQLFQQKETLNLVILKQILLPQDKYIINQGELHNPAFIKNILHTELGEFIKKRDTIVSLPFLKNISQDLRVCLVLQYILCLYSIKLRIISVLDQTLFIQNPSHNTPCKNLHEIPHDILKASWARENFKKLYNYLESLQNPNHKNPLRRLFLLSLGIFIIFIGLLTGLYIFYTKNIAIQNKLTEQKNYKIYQVKKLQEELNEQKRSQQAGHKKEIFVKACQKNQTYLNIPLALLNTSAHSVSPTLCLSTIALEKNDENIIISITGSAGSHKTIAHFVKNFNQLPIPHGPIQIVNITKQKQHKNKKHTKAPKKPPVCKYSFHLTTSVFTQPKSKPLKPRETLKNTV